MKNAMPNIAAYIRKPAVLAAANARSRKNRIGSIGCGARVSQRAKAATSRTPATSGTST
jgi:hypothetical protein